MRKKTAIIHDWLNGMRGGEKVLEEILDVVGKADIHTLFLEPENISSKIRSHPIKTSYLNRNRFIRKHYKHFLPLFPSAIESFNLRNYDRIISISHCAAKGIIPPPETPHISYVNSPMRYIWDQFHRYFGQTTGLKKYLIRWQATGLRNWDVTSSARVDTFIANSNFIRQRIAKYYRRDSLVLNPPVDTDFYVPADKPEGDYYLTVSALVPYKATELLVRAFNQTAEKLIVIGKGSEEKRLKKMAKSNIQFKKDISTERLREYYQNARAFIFAGIEDFGIVFAESHACGVPVIAYGRGGVLDIVSEETGILFPRQTTGSILKALSDSRKQHFDPSRLRENSLRFTGEKFRSSFKAILEKNS